MSIKERPSDKIQRLVNGRWDLVYQRLAPELSEAMEAAQGTDRPDHVGCPVHGGVDGFRFYTNWRETGGGICNTCPESLTNGIRVMAWLKDIDYIDALKLLLDDLEGGEALPRDNQVDRRAKAFADQRERREAGYRKALVKVWRESLPLDHPSAEPARLYFARRGLNTPFGMCDVRFHASLYYRDRKDKRATYWPGLVFRVRDGQGKSATVHRIYLTKEGRKAPVKKPKKAMPYPSSVQTLSGGAIRFHKQSQMDVLGVAEGPETALAVTEATGMPVWSSMSAEMMESLVIPTSVKKLFIWADKDLSGRGKEAALALCQRAWSQGCKVSVVYPPLVVNEERPSVDWLDAYNQVGQACFGMYAKHLVHQREYA